MSEPSEPSDPQDAPRRAAEPIEVAGDDPVDAVSIDDLVPPATVETTSVGYPSHYLDPPPETVIWAL